MRRLRWLLQTRGMIACTALAVLAVAAGRTGAQVSPADSLPAESNVIFGRYSGLALLMDIYRPPQPNGYGVVYVPGSGFHTPLGYDARPITVYTRPIVPILVRGGYTVFVVNHRAAPRFRHPAALEDVQRAVRFVRHGAAAWGIRPTPLAAAGYSSGGTLASLLGVLNARSDMAATDPVERESSTVQCVIAGGAAFDFRTVASAVALPIVGSYLGATITLGYSADGPEQRLYREASPVTHASAGDAPHLLIHGDRDEVLPLAQAEAMFEALRAASVPATRTHTRWRTRPAFGAGRARHRTNDSRLAAALPREIRSAEPVRRRPEVRLVNVTRIGSSRFREFSARNARQVCAADPMIRGLPAAAERPACLRRGRGTARPARAGGTRRARSL